MRDDLLGSVVLYWDSYRRTVGESDLADGIEGGAVRHALACLLARVRGRSQLEYLSDDAKARQADAVLRILPGPVTVTDLVEAFATAIESMK